MKRHVTYMSYLTPQAWATNPHLSMSIIAPPTPYTDISQEFTHGKTINKKKAGNGSPSISCTYSSEMMLIVFHEIKAHLTF